MRLQGLSPGMQNAEEADLSTEMLGIGSHLEQCGGAGFKQQGEENLLVLPDQGDQGVRDTEDEVIVADRQQFLLSGTQPLLPSVGLALWTVAIPTRVVGDGLIAATDTLITMAAQSRCPAADDGIEDLDLSPGQGLPIAFPEPASCQANHIGHLPEGPYHEGLSWD
jgi:hypothetical protein